MMIWTFGPREILGFRSFSCKQHCYLSVQLYEMTISSSPPDATFGPGSLIDHDQFSQILCPQLIFGWVADGGSHAAALASIMSSPTLDCCPAMANMYLKVQKQCVWL